MSVMMQISNAYKTTLCMHYMKGKCDLGVNCSLAHGNRELRSFENPLYKAQLCTAYEQGGVCQMGTDCLFAHGEDELRSDDIDISNQAGNANVENIKPNTNGEDKRGGFKSALCMHFAKHGSCHMGAKCTFAHGKEDLINIKAPDASDPKYKTKLCLRFAQDNFCPSGDYCVFAHGEGELKAIPEETVKKSPLYKSTLCHNFATLGVCPSGRNCSFAHGRYELRPAGFDGDFDAKILENPRWKCALCKNFSQTGHCSKSNCDFAHGDQELRTEMMDAPRILRTNYKTVMCNNWANNGHCFHEDTCTFAHGEDELAKFSTGKDVASTLKLIRGNPAGLRKRPTASISQTPGMLPSPPLSVTDARVTTNDKRLFAEFLEFKKFKEQTEGGVYSSDGMNQRVALSEHQQNKNVMMSSTTGYEPIKVLNSATGRQVAVTELMANRANGGNAYPRIRKQNFNSRVQMPMGDAYNGASAQQEMDYSY